MKKPHVALLALFAVAGLALCTFFALTLGRTSRGPVLTPEGAETARAAPNAAAPERPRELGDEEQHAAAPEASAAREVVEQRFGDWDAGQEVWVSGRVLRPAAVPPDETLRVLAFRRHISAADVHSEHGILRTLAAGGEPPASLLAISDVAPDGTFRIAFPGDAKRGWLALDGRYLFLGTTRELALDARTDVELVPDTGAWIHGRVSLPPDVDAASLLGETVVDLDLDVDQFEVMGMGGFSAGYGHATDVRPDGTFELRAVRAGRTYEIHAEHDDLANFSREGVELSPGEELYLEPLLTHGSRLLGRVVAPDGSAIDGAEVVAVDEFLFGFAANKVAEAVTAEDGSFELRGVPRGEVRVLAEATGYLTGEGIDVQTEDGAVVSDITLTLSTGARIAGHVRHPDGSPVRDADIQVSFDPAAMMTMGAFNAARGAEGSAATDADGRFEVAGLGKGPFLVRATADIDEGASWSAERAGVSPDTLDVELVLDPPATLRGRVIDESGAPVTGYTLSLSLVNTGGPLASLRGDANRTEEIEDETGAFAVEGLRKGTWRVEARAAGYGPSPQLEALLPDEEHIELAIALPPSASVSGRVLNPAGNPVVGATVALEPGPSDAMAAMMGELDSPEAVSDDEGRYALAGLGHGAHKVFATHPDWAGSSAASVDVAVGGAVAGIDLVLREGGVIRGLLYGRDGEPEGGTRIILQQPLTLSSKFVSTDPDGTFLADRLRPGAWQVTAFLDGANFGDDVAEEGDFTQMLENLRFTVADVVDGEETEVVLGAPPTDPVTVSGTVTVAGTPTGGGMLSFTPAGEGGFSSFKMTQVAVDGKYSVELNTPGEYHLQMQFVSASAMEQQTIEFNETIPAEREYRLDLPLPVGEIAGTVRGPDGDALADARVTLITEGAVQAGTFFGGQFAEITTDDAGRYVFRYLRPGSYSVAAGGAAFGGAFGTAAEHGRTVHDGIQVGADDRLTGIDFRLERAGDIRGVVRDTAGKPVADASVFVRDDRGHLLERFSMTSTGSDGAFVYAGVAPGDYVVSARSNAQASGSEHWVHVREGDTASVELVVDAGTMLVVTVVDSSGEDVDAWVSVTDERGREVNGMIGFMQIMGRMAEGFELDEQRVGPLPAGKYTVEVRAEDGRTSKKPVTLDGQAERKLKIRLR